MILPKTPLILKPAGSLLFTDGYPDAPHRLVIYVGPQAGARHPHICWVPSVRKFYVASPKGLMDLEWNNVDFDNVIIMDWRRRLEFLDNSIVTRVFGVKTAMGWPSGKAYEYSMQNINMALDMYERFTENTLNAQESPENWV